MNPNRTLFIRRSVARRLLAMRFWFLLAGLISSPIVILFIIFRSIK